MTAQFIVVDRGDIPKDATLVELATKYPPSGWEELFESAIPELELIDSILEEQGEFFPKMKDIFLAFEMCPLKNLKVIILGQDPYHSTYNGEPQACGIAFATREGCPLQPSIKNIYSEVKLEYPNFESPGHGFFSGWTGQGVLFINTCLTVTPHVPGSHKNIWRGFMSRVYEFINERVTTPVYMLWGRSAQKQDTFIGDNAIIIKATHPCPMSWKREPKRDGDPPAFYGSGVFTQANEVLEKSGKQSIDWTYVI